MCVCVLGRGERGRLVPQSRAHTRASSPPPQTHLVRVGHVLARQAALPDLVLAAADELGLELAAQRVEDVALVCLLVGWLVGFVFV